MKCNTVVYITDILNTSKYMLCREQVALLQLSQGQSRTCFHSRLSPGRIRHIWVLWLGTQNHPLGLAAAGGAIGAICAIHKAHQAPHSKGSAGSLTTHTWNATSALDCEPETSGYPSSCKSKVYDTHMSHIRVVLWSNDWFYIFVYVLHGPWNLFIVSQLFLSSKRLSNDVELWLGRFLVQIMRCPLFAPCFTVASKAWLMVSCLLTHMFHGASLHPKRCFLQHRQMNSPFVSIPAINSLFYFSLSECGSSRLL